MNFWQVLCETLLICSPHFASDGILENVTMPMAYRKAASTKDVAVILESSGSTLIKFRGTENWLRSFSGLTLQPGDKLQALGNATLRVEYYGVGASVVLNEFSYWQVTSAPPKFSRFKRKSGVANAKLWVEINPLLGNQSSTTIAAPSQQEQKVNQSGPIINNGMHLQRDVTRIPVLQPQGDVTIVTEALPAKLDVVLEKTWKTVGLWAYLWSTSSPQPEIAWVGFARGGFKSIPLAKSGDYLLQVITEDETRTTRPIKIAVHSAQTIDNFLDTWLTSNSSEKTLTLEVQ